MCLLVNNRDKVFSSEAAMSEEKTDRRVQRTRDLLKRALMNLVREKGYDAVTIQDITDRANLGRTTFYLHYQSKEELLLDHYTDFTSAIQLEKLTRDQLLDDAPQPQMVTYLEQLNDERMIYLAFTEARDSKIIMRGIRQQMTDVFTESLREAFPETEPSMPLPLLAQYIGGAQLALINWWTSNRTSYTAEEIAGMLHRLQRAAIRDCYSL